MATKPTEQEDVATQNEAPSVHGAECGNTHTDEVLGALAACCQDQQMFSEAESLHQSKLFLLNQNPEDNKHDIAVALHNLAVTYKRSGRLEKAMEMYRRSIELEIQVPDLLCDPLSLATTMEQMGECMVEDGRQEMALPFLEKALCIKKERLPGDHIGLAEALLRLSVCCEQLGDLTRSKQLCEESLVVASHCLPVNHADIASYKNQLASCYCSAGNLDMAIQLTEQCIVVERHNLPAARSDLLASLHNLGVYYTVKGMLLEAIVTLEECLSARRSILPPDHPHIATTLLSLGRAYEEGNCVVKATESFKECLSIREKSLRASHPDLVDVLRALNRIAFNQERYEESLLMTRRLYDILKRTSAQSEDMATVCYNMGMCCMKLSHLDAAEEAFTQSLGIETALYPQGDERIATTERQLHEIWQLKFGN